MGKTKIERAVRTAARDHSERREAWKSQRPLEDAGGGGGGAGEFVWARRTAERAHIHLWVPDHTEGREE